MAYLLQTKLGKLHSSAILFCTELFSWISFSVTIKLWQKLLLGEKLIFYVKFLTTWNYNHIEFKGILMLLKTSNKLFSWLFVQEILKNM